MEELGHLLEGGPSATAFEEGVEGGHLSDDDVVSYLMGAHTAPEMQVIREHLNSCSTCADEISRLEALAGFWQDAAAVARLQTRVKNTMRALERPEQSSNPMTDALGRLWDAARAPFAVSLKPVMIPHGAYGETREDETSTLEFLITHNGKIVEGLRGLLKRVNREYYVRIFAVDPGARSQYGDNKALLSISDTQMEKPILHRKIDIGVTVLLGTDFRLTDNSRLAVEMLSSAN